MRVEPMVGAASASMRRVDEHRRLQVDALAAEGEGHAALLAGAVGTEMFARAAALYRRSWEAAPPEAWGRLVGYVKAAVLAGEAREAAGMVLEAVGPAPASPTAAYAA